MKRACRESNSSNPSRQQLQTKAGKGRVCARHFAANHVVWHDVVEGVVYKRDRPKLTDDAVPSIFNFPPDEPKPEKPKKEKPIKPAKPAKTCVLFFSIFIIDLGHFWRYGTRNSWTSPPARDNVAVPWFLPIILQYIQNEAIFQIHLCTRFLRIGIVVAFIPQRQQRDNA
jgi:hypothetical protein